MHQRQFDKPCCWPRAKQEVEEVEARAKQEVERVEARAKQEVERAQAETEETKKELNLTRGRLDDANKYITSDIQEINKKDKEIKELKKELKGLDLILLALKILRQSVHVPHLNCSNQARLCRC